MFAVKISSVFFLGVAVYGSAGKNLDLKSFGEERIIGGDEVDITEYPHQAMVLLDGELLCGGSILSEEYVLTAAHCAQWELDRSTVKVGSTYYKEGKEHKLQKIIVHPLYNKNDRLDYDIAVLKVADNIEIDGVTTKAVQLAEANSKLEPGTVMVISGWGVTEEGTESEVLKAVAVPVFEWNRCKKVWSNITKITERMLCAGYEEPGRSSCYGDSGSALIERNTSVQYGLTSFAMDCWSPGIPTVYTDVPAVRPWIKELTGI